MAFRNGRSPIPYTQNRKARGDYGSPIPRTPPRTQGPKLYDEVKLVSGDQVTILADYGDGWYEVEFVDERSEGCPQVERINRIEIMPEASDAGT